MIYKKHSQTNQFYTNYSQKKGLRDCVKWVQRTEQEQKWFFDLVVRLRDDTLALGPWILDSSYLGFLTSAKSGNFRGINDHNFVVDREWADKLLRGLVEDYYFNSSLENVMWGSAEMRVRQMAEAYNIPMRTKNICEQPLIPLRGLVNESHWRLHPLYVRHFDGDCAELAEQNSLGRCCDPSWARVVASKVALAMPPPSLRKKRLRDVSADEVEEEEGNGKDEK